jgi:hypothetical protein
MRYSCYSCSQNIQIEVRFAASQDHKNRLNCTAWYAFFKGSWTPSKWTCQGWPFWWFGSIINNFLGFVGEKSRLFRDPVVDLARPSQPGEKLESGFTIPTIPTIATIPFIAPPAHPSFFFFLSLPCAVSPVIFRRSRATGDGNTKTGGIQSLGINGAFPSASW